MTNPNKPPDGTVPGVVLIQAGTSSPLYPFRSHPLGLMYLASALRAARPGTRLRIIDMKVSLFTPRTVAGVVAADNYPIAGIGGFSVHSDLIYDTAREIKSLSPDTFIIAGGPHANSNPEETIKSGHIDAVIAGEGEAAFSEAVAAIQQGVSIEGIPGIVCKKDGAVHTAPARMPAAPDSIPFPSWDLINFKDYEKYASFSILGRRRYMSLFTSRGCPFKCIYCHNLFGKSFRPRSADNITAEVLEINSRFGISDFDILDDVFNFKREHTHAVLESLLATGKPLTLAFPNGLRSDLLDDETLRLMRRAGTMYISFAIESASPRMQKLMKKNLDIEKAGRAIRTAAKLGIFCNGFFMLGFPDENEAELRETTAFAVKSPLHTAHFLKVTAFEGTELSSMPAAEKSHSTGPGSMKYYDRSYNLSNVENHQFNRLMASAHRRFYINPFRILRLIAAHPFKRNLLHFAAFALRRIIFSSSKG